MPSSYPTNFVTNVGRLFFLPRGRIKFRSWCSLAQHGHVVWLWPRLARPATGNYFQTLRLRLEEKWFPKKTWFLSSKRRVWVLSSKTLTFPHFLTQNLGLGISQSQNLNKEPVTWGLHAAANVPRKWRGFPWPVLEYFLRKSTLKHWALEKNHVINKHMALELGEGQAGGWESSCPFSYMQYYLA